MKLTSVLITALSLLAAVDAKKCHKAGQACDNVGNRACQCNSGDLIQCASLVGGNFYIKVKTCPNAGNRLQCANGFCCKGNPNQPGCQPRLLAERMEEEEMSEVEDLEE